MELIETIVLGLVVVTVVGLIVRKRGDNTMDTMSKGCGCIFLIIILIIIGAIAYGIYLGNYDKFFN